MSNNKSFRRNVLLHKANTIIGAYGGYRINKLKDGVEFQVPCNGDIEHRYKLSFNVNSDLVITKNNRDSIVISMNEGIINDKEYISSKLSMVINERLDVERTKQMLHALVHFAYIRVLHPKSKLEKWLFFEGYPLTMAYFKIPYIINEMNRKGYIVDVNDKFEDGFYSVRIYDELDDGRDCHVNIIRPDLDENDIRYEYTFEDGSKQNKCKISLTKENKKFSLKDQNGLLDEFFNFDMAI